MKYDIYTAYLEFVKKPAEEAAQRAEERRRAEETGSLLREWHAVASRILFGAVNGRAGAAYGC